MGEDWQEIKANYIETDISLRALAKKYGINSSTMAGRAAREKWTQARAERREEKVDGVLVPTEEEKGQKREAERATRLAALVDMLVERLETAVEQLDRTMVKTKRKMREVEYGQDEATRGKPSRETVVEEEAVELVEAPIDRQGLGQVVLALKRVRDIAGAGSGVEGALEKLDQLMEEIGHAAEQ